MSNQNIQKIKYMSWIIFVIYIIVLSYLLFFSEEFGRTENDTVYRYNLVLFREIKRFIQYRRLLGIKMVMINIVGNVAVFLPFGFFLPILSRRVRKLRWIFVLSFLLSLSIEATQLIFRVGCFDVDDLFLNTLGGIMGFLIYRIGRVIGGIWFAR